MQPMRTQFCLLLTALISFSAFAQIKGQILDSTTKEPIPYVNIWIEGEENGATANEIGEFILAKADADKTIIFSAVGYGETRIKVNAIKPVINLEPKAIELDGLTIVPRKNKLKRIVNPMNAIDETYFASTCSGSNPMMLARYIPYREKYSETPFISSLNFLTHSNVRNTLFYVRLYSVNKDGNPGELLHDEPITGKAITKKKGVTTVDVSKLNIQIPETGLFVAIEWLIIERNEFLMYIAGNKKGSIHYTPTFKNVYLKNNYGRWIYQKGEWKHEMGLHNNKPFTFAVELTLTD